MRSRQINQCVNYLLMHSTEAGLIRAIYDVVNLATRSMNSRTHDYMLAASVSAYDWCDSVCSWQSEASSNSSRAKIEAGYSGSATAV